jgi:aminomethyltransferase
MTNNTLFQTPLAPEQETLNARFVDFGGWSLPVLYTSIQTEVDAVRTHCGLFDVSHMGRFFVSGETAGEFLDWLVTRDLTALRPGKQRYTLLLNESGGVLDDLMISQVGEQEFLLVVNAGNRDKDFEWIENNITNFASRNLLSDRSDETLMLALQGPESEKILTEVLSVRAGRPRPYGSPLQLPTGFLDVLETTYEGFPVVISRSGYTGEDGFEIILPIEPGILLWAALVTAGVTPCGLGARDLLRLEMAYPLYGHELTEEVRPHECSLEWTLSKKHPYLGKEAILANPPRYDLIGFVCDQKAVPRAGYPIEVDSQGVGMVTSGGLSSHLPNGFGLARVKKGSVIDRLDLVIRGKRIPAQRVPTPFVPDRVKR